MFILAFIQMSKQICFNGLSIKIRSVRSKVAYTFFKLYSRAIRILKAELSHKLLNVGLFLKFEYEDQDGFLKV